MFFRVFLCVVALAITAAAQSRNSTPVDEHTPPVVVAVSPNGQTLAVARGNKGAANRYGRVELWNTQTGELERTITGFDGPVWALTFSRDGRSLITTSTEYRESKIQGSVKDRDDERVTGELKWWNAQTGEFIRKVSVASDGVASMEATWSPSGDLIALAERHAERQLSQVSVPGPFGPRIMMPGYVNLEETELRLLDAETGQRRVKLEDAVKRSRGNIGLLYARLERPIFSPDGAKVAALTAEDVSIWAADSGRKIVTLKKLNGWPTAIAFSEDSRLLAVASVKGRMPGGESEIGIWDATTGKSVNRLKGKNDLISCLQFAARGRALLIGSLQYEPEGATGTVKMWDVRENRLGRFNVHADEAVSSLTLIPEQDAVVLQSGSDIELRDAKTWDVRYSFAPTEADDSESMRRSRFLLTAKRALAVEFSADGTTVSAQIPGEGIRVWDVRTGGLTNHVPRSEISADLSVAAGNGGVVAEAQGESGQIQLLDAKNKQPIRKIDAGQKITALAIDLSGRLLAAARADHAIVLWDLKTGALQSELRKHQDTINALAFSPDGSMLASGGDDRTAVLWDVSSGKARRTLKGHDVTVTSLAFSPDGQTLATGSGNAAVVLWNVATGKLDRILH
jgi:WD40 repeat protein